MAGLKFFDRTGDVVTAEEYMVKNNVGYFRALSELSAIANERGKNYDFRHEWPWGVRDEC